MTYDKFYFSYYMIYDKFHFSYHMIYDVVINFMFSIISHMIERTLLKYNANFCTEKVKVWLSHQ